MTGTVRFERRTYIPLVFIPQGDTVVPSLDLHRASYRRIKEEVKVWDPITVLQEDEGQPDAISYRAYGSSELDWLILMYNGIVDPYKELVAGMVMRAPRLTEVALFLHRAVETIDQNVGTVVEV